MHFMQQVCLAQAQECILEKSMMDNRKATIIGRLFVFFSGGSFLLLKIQYLNYLAKVAVQVIDYYKRSITILQSYSDDALLSDFVSSYKFKEWVKYLNFKISYHKSISLLFQGQQAEEQRKMGERVAYYQAACEQMDIARKLSSNMKQQKVKLIRCCCFRHVINSNNNYLGNC